MESCFYISIYYISIRNNVVCTETVPGRLGAVK
jgi:hypothetical protein